MAERRNYELNAGLVLKDIYRLLALVLSERSFGEVLQSMDDPLLKIRHAFIEDELIHLLINIAIMNRLRLEHMGGLRGDASELSFEPVEGACGKIRTLNSDKTEELSFREACNKVIHADRITAQSAAGENGFEAYPNKLELAGTFGDRAWMAQLDLLSYLRLSAQNFMHF